MHRTLKTPIGLGLFTTLLSLFALNSFADKQIVITSDDSRAGRLHLVLSPNDEEEPRFYSAWPTLDIEPLFSIDLQEIEANTRLSLSDFNGFPYNSIAEIPKGRYFAQLVYDTNTLESGINSPGNTYSNVQVVELEDEGSVSLSFSLANTIEPDALPSDETLLKFVKFKSQNLTEFWETDMYLRAGVLLPATYYDNPLKRYPVFFDIGGYGSRFTRASRWYNNDEFMAYWRDPQTPQMIIVFLDGEAPFGDPYQINSANNGPYGDATWKELLPYLAQNFNMVDDSSGRFVSGCSTGGWVSLALQLYYPDTFNGAWSFSADGVDFQHFQLVDVYNDDNAYINEHQQERPSYRQKDGDVIFSIRREIAMENTLGRNNTFATSGGQWGGWNAVYSPRGEDGLPMPIWDPVSGQIDEDVAEQWRAFDLRQYTEENWTELGPKLQGKLHIWMGDMDNFYLNNAMYVYQEMLASRTEPTSDARFTFERGVGHCDYNQVEMRKKTISEMMQRFAASQ